MAIVGVGQQEEVVGVRLIAMALGVLVVLVVVGVLVVRWAIRRAGRRIGGWQWRFVELRTRFQPPGPGRDAGRLRCRLGAELRATRDMLQAAPQGLIFRADATSLFQELSATATAIDGELAAIERFIDAGQQRKALAVVRPQAERLIETTYSARQTLLRTAAEDRERQLSALRSNVATQAAALETYQRNGRELSL
jgi:hypothetical protein